MNWHVVEKVSHTRFPLNNWLLAFILFLPLIAAAQKKDCRLPPPPAAWLTEVNPTSIALAWEQAPGAVMYRVRAWDLSGNGQQVANFQTPQTEATLTNLTPGHLYAIEIQASACPDGPFGRALRMEAQTSIIIVDVIIQRKCPEATALVNWPSNYKVFALDMAGTDVFRIKLEDTAYGAVCAFSAHAQGTALEIEFHTIMGCSLVATDSVLTVQYNTPPPGFPNLLQLDIANSLAPAMLFGLEKAPGAVVYERYCGGNGFSDPAEDRGTEAEAGLQVWPNPARDRLWIRWNPDGPVDGARYQLTDLNGRILQTAAADNSFESIVPLERLLPGTYLLHLQQGAQHLVRKVVKLP